MPSVGRKRFPYTSAGKAAAKRHARKTGRPIRNTSGNRSGLENRGGSRMMRTPGMTARSRRMSGLGRPRRMPGFSRPGKIGGGLVRGGPSLGGSRRRPSKNFSKLSLGGPRGRNKQRGY